MSRTAPENTPVSVEDNGMMTTAIRAHLSKLALSYEEYERQSSQDPTRFRPAVPVKISGCDFSAHVMSLVTSKHGWGIEEVALIVDTESPSGDHPQTVIICKDDKLMASALRLPYGEQVFSPVADVLTFPNYWSIPDGPELFDE